MNYQSGSKLARRISHTVRRVFFFKRSASVDEKWFGSSKTIIFNVATLVVAIGGAIQGLEFMSPKAIAAIGAAVAVANIVLRIVTKSAVTLKKSGDA